MQVLNFGSLNIDHVYIVEHFVAPGETLASLQYKINAGGKGLNQSIALSRAGVETFHAGMIGKDGLFLKELLERSHVNTKYVLLGELPTGHAIIQVEEKSGENSILLYPGANNQIGISQMRSIIHSMPAGSWLLLQNEINSIPFLIEEGKKRNLKIAINPAPCNEKVCSWPLHLCDLIIVNEIEGAQLSGMPEEKNVHQIAEILAKKFPDSEIVITLGAYGALYRYGSIQYKVPARKVTAVDTTSAGDTFSGYFLAAKLRGMTAEDAVKCAVYASSITVSRPGAAESIACAEEVFPHWEVWGNEIIAEK